jgi:hypothetical protein
MLRSSLIEWTPSNAGHKEYPIKIPFFPNSLPAISNPGFNANAWLSPIITKDAFFTFAPISQNHFFYFLYERSQYPSNFYHLPF